MHEWIFGLIRLVIGVVSPELRTGVAALLDKLEEQAKRTSNPWDDILVAMLKQIMTGK
ncbi:unnamed protein product [marine sediment metagenome]|uniref:Uncharacterized protein n=1 Tax=marine sediment metagenome TaxID=412755 RepID=X1GD67_9ZZZZ